MSEVDDILKLARAKGAQRAAAYTPPDYKAAQPIFVKQKAALTRAINSRDPEKVVLACQRAVAEWGQAPFNGAWPDDWSRWQRALDDALGFNRTVRLEDL